ncbi:hypothetical protein CMUS01_08245 [Colletotrichum musicola]|uniref:Aminoglycoside phosphotransferase domain-containing protein n=1 Tax=Colletotrichum musicola TaxID=2175873 RepID=A0A8H6KCP8_9PEZI|nr:hypothetical protein CMUS01_08245 [Colletotrichum musicola]
MGRTGSWRSCTRTFQGVTSYAAEAAEDDKGGVVQFRPPDGALDIGLIQRAQEAYGSRFVPCPREAEGGGSLTGLQAYIMNNVGGVSAYLARDQLRADDNRLLRVTVKDLALPASIATPSRSQLYASYEADLKQLKGGLPARWRETLDRLLGDLSLLFASDWPMVPNHTDLLENNIHVDSSTGHITGICDWQDTAVSPFGTSLWGLESVLGERTTTGWRWVSNSAKLRWEFWDAFAAAFGSQVPLERAQTARLVGVLLKSGFEWTDRGNRRPVAEGSSDLLFLEAISLKAESGGS